MEMEDILKAKNSLLEGALAAVTLPIATTNLECLAESDDDHNTGVYFDLVNTSSSYVQIESIVATKHCTMFQLQVNLYWMILCFAAKPCFA